MRTNYCGEITKKLLGEEVIVCGWVHRRRDHGGVIFLDLRDTTGIVQLVINPDAGESFKIAEDVRGEYVLKATAKVDPRPCLLYTSPSPRDRQKARMPSSA